MSVNLSEGGYRVLEQILISILHKNFDQIKLANELNITQDELKSALDHLCVTGYLQNKSIQNGSCHRKCTDCNQQQDCPEVVLYTLTVKGKKIAENYFL